jgi:hypothetical protein
VVLIASRQQAATRRHRFVTPGGAVTFVSTYLGTNKMELLGRGRTPDEIAAGAEGPMAYLVEQEADSTVEAHFHEVPQFQIFLGGSGQIGTHRLEGVTVHYAGAHSPYGPIVAGPHGVQYLTLRRSWDGGAQWMPGAASVLRGMSARKHVAFTSPPLDRATVAGERPVGKADVVLDPAAAGGAGAWLMKAPPDAPLPNPASSGRARFLYMLAGAARGAGIELSAGSCLYASDSDDLGPLRTGPDGAELVQVQFPAA